MQSKLDNNYEPIRAATYGIAFFGTPHRGGNFSALGDIASTIVRGVLRNPNNTFMEALKSDSLFAESIVEDFRHQLEDYYVLSFYETLPFKNLGLVSNFKYKLEKTKVCRLSTANRPHSGFPEHVKRKLPLMRITQMYVNLKELMVMTTSKWRIFSSPLLRTQ